LSPEAHCAGDDTRRKFEPQFVAAAHVEERRDVQCFVRGVDPGWVGAKEVDMPLGIGVVDFGDDADERSGSPTWSAALKLAKGLRYQGCSGSASRSTSHW